jgi:hypothetical protein
MNGKIGVYASAINLCAIFMFAISMLLGSLFLSYLSSIFIAFSFVVMICTFAYSSEESSKVAGLCAVAFGTMYAICNSIVYFIQLTTVRNGNLTGQASSLLDFQQFGLMFNLDMLGYCLMALSTFFVGLTVAINSRADRWLKWLLIIHGVFAVSCFIMPMLGLFDANMEGSGWIGTAVLEFWCVYFTPISILSILHFSKKS